MNKLTWGLLGGLLMASGICQAGNVTIAIGNGSVAVNNAGGRGNGIQGSGKLASDTRNVAAFSAVELGGAVDISIAVGGAQSVTVKADDNVLPHVRTEVVGGKLKISMNQSVSTRNKLQVVISTPSLTALTVDGSGDAEVSRIAGNAFRLLLSGSSNVRLAGAVDSADIAVTGSGDVNGKGLTAKRAKVSINGSGDVSITALESLKARIDGSGDINYYGNPRSVDEQVSGAGDVNKR